MSRGITRICPNLFRSLPAVKQRSSSNWSNWSNSLQIFKMYTTALDICHTMFTLNLIQLFCLLLVSFFFIFGAFRVVLQSNIIIYFFYVKIKCLDVGLGLHRCRIHLQRKLLLCKTAVHTCCEYATLSGANVYYTVFPLVL